MMPTKKQQAATYPGNRGRSATQRSKQNLFGPYAGAFTENRLEKYAQSPAMTELIYRCTIQDCTTINTADIIKNNNDTKNLPSLTLIIYYSSRQQAESNAE